jgi:hypothetical protein
MNLIEKLKIEPKIKILRSVKLLLKPSSEIMS